MKDYIIVGLGFAGISLVHILEKNKKSFVVFNDQSQRSTLTAGGFFNPVVLKRFTPVWQGDVQMKQLIPFYTEIQQKLGVKIIEKIPVLRKFASLEEQNNWFVAADKPILNQYLSLEIKQEISPFIESKFGLGEVLETGRILTENLTSAYEKKLQNEQLLFNETFDYSQLEILENSVLYKNIQAKQIIFCEGYGVIKNPFFNYLPMAGCKGELLTFKAPQLNVKEVVKSAGFIFPEQNGLYKIGATYEHSDKSNTPTQKARTELEEKLKNLISCPFEITQQQVGIRPTVRDRRPLVGQHPIHKNLYILNGLGTRGSMLGPYTAGALFHFIENNIPIEKEINITRLKKRAK